jgi:GNAT superfamily N-acetyltransferase
MLRVPLIFGWSGFQRLHAYDVVAQKLHRTHAPGNHWYLWAIGVQPEQQGKGIGGQLMAPILSRADRESTPCYLETHVESNVRVYERAGFKVTFKSDVPGHPLPVWAMFRTPGSR